jgi:hypothetical protein
VKKCGALAGMSGHQGEFSVSWPTGLKSCWILGVGCPLCQQSTLEPLKDAHFSAPLIVHDDARKVCYHRALDFKRNQRRGLAPHISVLLTPVEDTFVLKVVIVHDEKYHPRWQDLRA